MTDAAELSQRQNAREMRDELGLSREKLARLFKISATYIYRMEAGTKPLQSWYFKKLKKMYDNRK